MRRFFFFLLTSDFRCRRISRSTYSWWPVTARARSWSRTQLSERKGRYSTSRSLGL